MTSRYKPRLNFAEETIGNDLMVFDPDTDVVHVLNESAAFIWRCLKEGLDETVIEKQLRQTYDVEKYSDLTELVRKMLEQFMEKGLIENRDPLTD